MRLASWQLLLLLLLYVVWAAWMGLQGIITFCRNP
jgi:hypothetical protein